MRAWWAAISATVGAILLGIIGSTPPSPLPGNAPVDAFSATRAMTDVRAIARAPHPVGTAEHARVRAVLVARLSAMGLETTTSAAAMSEAAAKRLDTWRGHAEPAPPIVNVIARLRGRDRALPAVLLMAHYDSVWGSPGAADDSAGVASVLETVRAIRAHGAPRRDLIVLLSDGEELGLEGAKAFFAADPRRSRIGVIVNLETRGGGGRASMFETGRQNGAMMRVFAQAVNRPVTTSLSVFIYEHLPNSTDYTVAKKLGVPGFNFAFIGRAGLYHSPLATPDALDQGALQDMGRQTLDLTRALLDTAALPGKAPDRTFFDAFGLVLIAYPAALGWLLLALGAGGYAVAAWRRSGMRDVTIGAVAMVALAIVAGILLYLANLVSGADGAVNYYDRLAAIPRLQAQALLLCLAAFAIVWGMVARWCRLIAGIVAGLAMPLLLLGALAQFAAPTASYPIVVPVMLGGLALGMGRFFRIGGRIAQIVAAALVVGYMIAFGYFLLQAIGPGMPMAAALPLAVCALVLAPLVPAIARGRAIAVAGVLILAALAIALGVRLDAIAPSVAVYSSDH